MRLPDNRAAVVDHRNARVGIHGSEFSGIEPAIFAACIDPFVDYSKLADGPHDFLDIDGIRAAPDFQHGSRALEGAALAEEQRLAIVDDAAVDAPPAHFTGEAPLLHLP